MINVSDKYEYVDLISLIEETNRCPGGKRTINQIVQNSLLSDGQKVLEIGSNTGFTSIEIAKLRDVQIVGIDINENAVDKSNQLLKKEPKFIQERVQFRAASAMDIPFSDNSFDLIVTGGANSFIDPTQRENAFKEYKRVLKPYGILSITNLYYDSPPTKKVLEDLKETLGFEVLPYKKNYWLNLFLSNSWELYSYKEQKLVRRPDWVLRQYINNLTSNSDLFKNLPEENQQIVKRQWLKTINTFNNNHEYLSFMTVLLRKAYLEEQQELFFEEGAVDPWNIDTKNLTWEI